MHVRTIGKEDIEMLNPVLQHVLNFLVMVLLLVLSQKVATHRPRKTRKEARSGKHKKRPKPDFFSKKNLNSWTFVLRFLKLLWTVVDQIIDHLSKTCLLNQHACWIGPIHNTRCIVFRNLNKK